MSKINLLPWREEMKKKLNYLFFFNLGATFFLSSILIMFVNMYLDYRLEVENANVAYIDNAMKDVKNQVTEIQELQENKKQLIERMNVIQSLEADRTSIIKLLNTIPQIMPDNVYLVQLSRKELGEEQINQDINENKPATSTVANIDEKQKIEPNKALQKKYLIELEGISLTNGGISILLKNLETIKWISEVKLNEVSINQEGEGLEFRLVFMQNLINRE